MKDIYKKLVMKNFKIKIAGDFGFYIIPEIENKNELIYNLASEIKKYPPRGLLDVIPSLVNLLIVFDLKITSSDNIIHYLNGLKTDFENIKINSKTLWEIPICYDANFGQDIEYVAKKCNLDPEEVISLHLNNIYHVGMMGFLPGLPFMGDLNQKLSIPRRSQPRDRVPSGSVGIAIKQTIIYPNSSPGGWHLIARTPITLFDQRRINSILLSIGDTVKFKKISLTEFNKIFEQNKKSPIKIKFQKI